MSFIDNLPNWYGIPGIKFWFQNCWADPDIIYNGRTLDSYIVEDTMWEEFTHDDNGNFIPKRDQDFKGFEKYMQENADYVKELFLLALGEGPLAA